MMKRAQTEMLGMAIVILLLSIGILIVVGIVMNKSSEPSTKQSYSEKQLATNILGSILSTTTNCNNERISTLMIDCGRDWPLDCPSEHVTGVTLPVCKYLNETVYSMLNETLKQWNKKYSFLAYVQRTNPKINITNRIDECFVYAQGELQREFYYLPLQAGSMTVELEICS